MADLSPSAWHAAQFYAPTEHECLGCGEKLRLATPSNMLVCVNSMCDHDPMFLIPVENEEGEAHG